MKYRADIDGLRAIAVLAVVIFHLDVVGFEGGFVGVDVFFVISGFLITSIIKRNHDSGTFSFRDFYARRVRRLLPPLVATVAVSMVFAALLFTPYIMVGFAKSAAAALFSLSNIVFFAESGYWDSASELKPLLHTWSLGVEEQFYLLWPALVIGLLSLGRWISFWVSLALITVLGAALCVWYTHINASAAFYLLPFRVFQFSLGACLIPVCAYVARQQASSTHSVLLAGCFWAGLLGIGTSVFLFDEQTLFPGWAVLLPTVASGLLIISGANPLRRYGPATLLLENPLSLWLGRVSYSMYLAHWPVVVFYRYTFSIDLTVPDQMLLALGTLAATCVLHYGVEQRFYHRGAHRSGADGRFALATIATAGILATVSSTAWLGNGWGWRFEAISLSAAQVDEGMQRRFTEVRKICHIRNMDAPKCKSDAALRVLVLGNSLEVDGLNFMLGGYADDPTLQLIRFGSTTQCPKLRRDGDGFTSSEERCQQRLDTLFRSDFLQDIDVVVYAANRPYDSNKAIFLDMLTLAKQRNATLKVVTFGGYINTERDCAYYVNETGTTAACALAGNVRYFADSPETQPLYARFRDLEDHYIDRVDLLCKNRLLESCLTQTDDGTPMAYDYLHTSLEFSLMSGSLYRAAYPDLFHSLPPGTD